MTAQLRCGGASTTIYTLENGCVVRVPVEDCVAGRKRLLANYNTQTKTNDNHSSSGSLRKNRKTENKLQMDIFLHFGF
jgi:hypothetical protein